MTAPLISIEVRLGATPELVAALHRMADAAGQLAQALLFQGPCPIVQASEPQAAEVTHQPSSAARVPTPTFTPESAEPELTESTTEAPAGRKKRTYSEETPAVMRDRAAKMRAAKKPAAAADARTPEAVAATPSPTVMVERPTESFAPLSAHLTPSPTATPLPDPEPDSRAPTATEPHFTRAPEATLNAADLAEIDRLSGRGLGVDAIAETIGKPRALVERRMAEAPALVAAKIEDPYPNPDVDAVLNTVRSAGPVVVPLGTEFMKFLVNGQESVGRDALVIRANRVRQRMGLRAWTFNQVNWARPAPEEGATFKSGFSFKRGGGGRKSATRSAHP